MKTICKTREEVIEEVKGDKCDCCEKYGEDRRTLAMACGYDMNEFNIPFEEVACEDVPGFGNSLYTLFVCKDCRADWMTAIEIWFNKHGGK